MVRSLLESQEMEAEAINKRPEMPAVRPAVRQPENYYPTTASLQPSRKCIFECLCAEYDTTSKPAATR